jgi:hypothetical protein
MRLENEIDYIEMVEKSNYTINECSKKLKLFYKILNSEEIPNPDLIKEIEKIEEEINTEMGIIDAISLDPSFGIGNDSITRINICIKNLTATLLKYSPSTIERIVKIGQTLYPLRFALNTCDEIFNSRLCLGSPFMEMINKAIVSAKGESAALYTQMVFYNCFK